MSTLDEQVAAAMDVVPCDDYERRNLGSAGGPVLIQRCRHEPGRCYSTVYNGPVGGLPKYSTDIRRAFEVMTFWRDTGEFCCIELYSDYNFVWDVRWVKDTYGSHTNDDTLVLHHKQSVGYSFDELPRAICVSFLAAIGRPYAREDTDGADQTV